MQDEYIHTDAGDLLSRVGDRDDFIELCKEYFEIAIGCRKPNEKEQSQACRLLLQGGIGEDQSPEGLVKVMKYPLSVDNRGLIQMFYQLEYVIFQILADETSFVEGPYLPMFRYEILKQKPLSEESNYDAALLRQSAFLETFFKMKIGKWKDSYGNFLSWELCIACAYRGENLLTEGMIQQLRKLASVRNRFAHDWRQYAMRGESDMTEIKDAYRAGLGAISELYSQELRQTYLSYTSQPIYQRYSTQWEERDKSVVSANTPTITVGISCENCGYSFQPRDEGWKRCPKCDTPHDYLERFSTPDS